MECHKLIFVYIITLEKLT